MAQGFSGVGLVSSHARTAGGKGIGAFWRYCPKFGRCAIPPAPTAPDASSARNGVATRERRA